MRERKKPLPHFLSRVLDPDTIWGQAPLEDLAFTCRVTAAQATIEFLKNQYVERDGVERRFFAGCFGSGGRIPGRGVDRGLLSKRTRWSAKFRCRRLAQEIAPSLNCLGPFGFGKRHDTGTLVLWRSHTLPHSRAGTCPGKCPGS